MPSALTSGTSNIAVDLISFQPTSALERAAIDESIAQEANPSRPRTRTQKTENRYAKRVRGFYLNSSDKRTTDPQNPVEASPLDVVQDLIDSASGANGQTPCAESSWSLYRSALLWHLSSHRHMNHVYEEAYQLLTKTKIPQSARKSTKTKTIFAGDDFNIIISTLGSLDKRNITWGAKTACWLFATVACGARVGEWPKTQWLNSEKLQLIIPNFKRKIAAPEYQKMMTADGAVASVNDLVENDEDEDHSSATTSTREDSGDTHRIVSVDPNGDLYLYIDMQMDCIRRHAFEQAKKGVDPEQAFIRYSQIIRRTLLKACQIAFNGKRSYRIQHARSQFSANMKVHRALTTEAGRMGNT
jgi:hypothetical protein